MVERVSKSYESLYLGSDNQDEQANEALRHGLQESFRRNDTLTSEIWTDSGYRDIFGYGVELGVESLQGSKITEAQREDVYNHLDTFVDKIDIFTVSDTEFYKTVFNQYEAKYEGETVDFGADYARYQRSIENEEVPDLDDMYREHYGVSQVDTSDMTDKELEEHVHSHIDHLFNDIPSKQEKTPAGVMEVVTEKNDAFKGSGLAYGKASPDVESAKLNQQAREYETKSERLSRRTHERVLGEVRDASGVTDMKHHDYATQDNPNQHFSHADGYGIEETDIRVKPKTQPKVVEDDGPEL